LTIGQKVPIKNSDQKHHLTIGQKNHPSQSGLVKIDLSSKARRFFYVCHFGVFFYKKTCFEKLGILIV
jgi:hypothetical protein